MISRITTISLDEKIWRYIRRNKKFVLGELMLVCSASPAYILPLLTKYETKGFIKLSNNDKTITNRTYIVKKELALNVGIGSTKQVGGKSYSSLKALLLFISESEQNEITYSYLLNKTGQLRGALKRSIHQLRLLNVLIMKDPLSLRDRTVTYLIDSSKIQEISSLIKDRNYTKIKSLIAEGVIPEPKIVETIPPPTKLEQSLKYKDTYYYKEKLNEIKSYEKEHGRKTLIEISKVSSSTISLIIKESYPNPQRMINTITSRIK